MRDGMPDSTVFPGVSPTSSEQARAGGSYPKVRVWGEMVDVLWERGDVAASITSRPVRSASKKVTFRSFCSFLMDHFNGDVHAHSCPGSGRITLTLFRGGLSRLERAVADALGRRSADEAASLRVGCSPAIGRPSRCRPPKRCCWHSPFFSDSG